MKRSNVLPPNEAGSSRDHYQLYHSRDFYKGTSVAMRGNWQEDAHYFNDEYFIDFVAYNGALLVCKKSHLSTPQNRPVLVYEEGLPIITGIEPSECWTFILAGQKGQTGNDGKSAYEIAVDAGYKGSEQEFAQLLNDCASFEEQISENSKQIATRPIVVYLRGDETQTDLASLYATLDKYLNDGTPFVVQMAMNEGIVEMTTICRSEADIFLGATFSQTDTTELTEDGGEIESANIQFYALLSSDGIMKSGQSLDTHNRMRLEEALNKKANTEGDYPDMSVGVAENLVGRGESVDTMFSYRSSGGVKPSGIKRSIETGDARITSIKGNSVVVNQLAASIEDMVAYRNAYFGINADGSIYIKKEDKAQNLALNLQASTTKQVIGNKYAVYYDGTAETININIGGFPTLSRGTTGIFTATNTQFFFAYPFGTGTDVIPSNTTFSLVAKLIDLTQMFGAGNEPTTVEEFYARVGELPDEYDAGTLRDMQVSAIETTGFNQWDEEWSWGALSTKTGEVIGTADKPGSPYGYLMSNNFCRCLPSMEYYCKAPSAMLIYWYDENFNYIGNTAFTAKTKFPDNAHYFKLRSYKSDYYTTYNHDICINLSHSGYKNGEYRPYELFRRAMPDLSKYFKGGVMRSVGNVCDEFRYNPTTQQWEAIQRVGVVDLGELVWSKPTSAVGADDRAYSSANIQDKKNGYYNLLCGEFRTVRSGEGTGVRVGYISGGGTSSYVFIGLEKDKYSSASEVKALLKGVMLNYELAEPVVKPVTENLNLVYDVNDFGTERAIQPEDSAPFRADVVYGFNAIDTIRTNAEAIEQLFARVAALESKTATS